MKWFARITTTTIAFALLIALLAGVSLAQENQILTVEVSENMHRFSFDQSKTFEDGLPAHGSYFVTQGYVYPAGTLNGSNGVNADGSPEFPELVIGEWICFGTLINDAAHASSGAWVVSTQIINLDSVHGAQSIVTTGYEFADDTPVLRAVSGGTGAYADARGEAKQVFTGLNASEGVVLSLELTLSGVEESDSAAIDYRDLSRAFSVSASDAPAIDSDSYWYDLAIGYAIAGGAPKSILTDSRR